MNKPLFLLALVSAWTAWPADLAAQEGNALRQGDRVRISAAEYGRTPFVGELVTRSPDTLTVNPCQRSTWCPDSLPGC